MDIKSIATEAIRTRQILYAKYKTDLSERILYPYAIFESTTGNIDLFCIQHNNPAKPIDKDQPRYFTLKDFSSARLGQTVFDVDTRFSPGHIKNCRRVIVSV